MSATAKATIRVTTAAGTNASAVGESYGSHEGCSWRNSVDSCDSDGCGRVFVDCDDPDTAAMLGAYMDGDDRVDTYRIE